MVFIYKSLADGQLPNAKGTLYTVPAATTCHIKSISYANDTAGALTCNLYLKRSGSTSRRISPKDLSLNAGSLAEWEDLTLSTGDIIEGDASAATSIDYTITGAER